MSARDSIELARTVKGDIVERCKGRADLVPVIEFRRADRLVAVMHAFGPREQAGTFVPTRSVALGARGFAADDVRVIYEGYVLAASLSESLPRHGDLERAFAEEPATDVRQALLVAVARPAEEPCHHVLPYEYAEAGGSIEVRWLDTAWEDAPLVPVSTTLGALLRSIWEAPTSLEHALATVGDELELDRAALDRAIAHAISGRGHAVLMPGGG